MMSSNHSPHNEPSESRILGSLKKPPNQAPPPGYFDTFAERLKERLEEEQLLEEAPMLRKAGKASPFRVPTGYFEQLPEQVAKVLRRRGSPGNVLSMRISVVVTAAAAVIMLLFLLRGVPTATETPSFPEMPDMSASELMAVVDIEEDLIIESLTADDLDQLMGMMPIPFRKNAEPEGEPLPSRSGDVSLDELLDELEDLDDDELDALEAELMEDDSEWF